MARKSLFWTALLLAGVRAWAAGPVTISEVHYHPPSSQGETAEFVELHNPTASAVALEGWRLKGGVSFTFPAGTTLAPGEVGVVCRDRDVLREVFPSASPRVLGTFEGSLANGGSEVLLVDAASAHVDSVPYDDRPPWPEAADGGGGSLQRICHDAAGRDPENWSGSGPPTPGEPTPGASCPPPSFALPAVVFSEVHYHPPVGPGEHPGVEDGEDEEFLELYNADGLGANLSEWSLRGGVTFDFPLGTLMAPGGYLVVARNQLKLREKHGITNIVGDFEGRLANDGEYVALHDRRGNFVDAVRYEDAFEWPYGADGYGPSLEKAVLSHPGSDPANWESSLPVSSTFLTLTEEGGLGQGLTQTFVISISSPGEAIVDDVVLEDVSNPGVNLLSGGDFNAGIDAWRISGFASESSFAPGDGAGGTGALRVVSTGFCMDGECGPSNSVSQSVTQGIVSGGRYRVSLKYKYVRGSLEFRAGLFRGASVMARDTTTPGRANSAASDSLPVHVSHVGRFPVEPRSTDKTWITALVRSAAAPQVTLAYDAGAGAVSLAMLDDGRHSDGLASDGVFGVELPSFPHNTQVRFRIRAVAGTRAGEYPRPRTPGAPLEEDVAGYYVNDLQPDSVLPVYHILLEGVDPTDPEDINDFLNCLSLEKGSFAVGGDLYPDVGVRFRGNTACYIQKRNFKVVFNRGAAFKGVRKINLNGLWTDKAILREPLAWEFLREIGAPHMMAEFVRLHLNGAYHGLFLYVEHPDSRFLDRTGLQAPGNLFKAKQPTSGPGEKAIGVERKASALEYRKAWERETNELGDYSDLVEFIDSMHADGLSAVGPTSAFWRSRSLEETIIGYQVGQVVLNNIDSYAKNHFLYHDLEQDRWGFIPWDLDLTFGKFFDPAAVLFPERPVGTLNDVMLGDVEGGDLNPWFTSTVLQNELYNWLVDFFFRAGDGWYQRAYLVRLWDILQDKYKNEVYDPKLDALRDWLFSEIDEDFHRWGRYVSNIPGHLDDVDSNLTIMKRQIQIHRDFLQSYVRTYHETIPEHPRVWFTEIMYIPEGGDDDLEFVELTGPADADVDLSGWSIPAVGYTFPKGSVLPAGKSAVVASSPASLLGYYSGQELPLIFGPYPGQLANEGEELRLLDAGPGHPATIDYVRYDCWSPWPEVRPGHSLEFLALDPPGDNDLPGAWEASSVLGGTPGSPKAGFIRGDAAADGRVNMTDPIFILSHLFLGKPPASCGDAEDSNDDGKIDITDAVYLLNHLFLGGPAPPQPYPEQGLDPTQDGLSC